MNKFSLKFIDKDLEKKYQSEAELEKTQRFISLVKMELLLSLLSAIYYTIKTSSFINLLCIILISIFLFFVKKFCTRILKCSLIAVFIAFTVLFTESIYMTKTIYGFTEEALALAVPLQLFTYAVLLTKTSWLYCALYYSSSIFYLFLRVFDWNKWGNKDLIFIGFIFSIMSFGFMSYKQEKTVREFYKSITDSDKSLTHFKLLVQNIMPDPIFIVDYHKSKVEFFNKSAFDMMNGKKSGSFNIEPQISDNLIQKTLKSNDFFKSYEKLMDTFKKGENSIEISGSISEILSNFYRSDNVQNIYQYNILKNQNIEFLTINAMRDENQFIKTDDVIHPHDHYVAISSKQCYDLKIAKIYWENEVCLLILFNDCSNLRKMIELQNLDEYKNRLLATVSHDLRTPLNGLLGIFEVVIPQISEPELQKNLTIGQRSANLLLYMINDILDFSQIIHKKIRLNLESVVIQDLVDETSELIEFQAKKKGLKFKVKLRNITEKFTFHTDANRIKQILLNLLSNSLKFTPNGFIKLIVEDFSHDFLKPTLKFTVKDSGIGIKENDKSKLFKLFGKLDQTDKDLNKTGVGLGLTISQELAKLLNRSEEGINLKSVFGNGSEFWFFVRTSEDDDENIFSIPESLKIKIPFSRSYSNQIPPDSHLKKSSLSPKSIYLKQNKVLIVDDDMINIMIVQKYMEFFGLNYLTATNGEEAFQIVKNDASHEITLILMDCNMPVLDGFQASKKILEFLKGSGLPEMPIIAVTANVEVADQEKCFSAGMKKFLTKPVKRKDMGIALQCFLPILFN